MLFISEENLNEMASVCKDRDENILIAVNPDSNRIGDAYFKFCNNTNYNEASKIIRILFNKVGYTVHTDGKELWELNGKEKKLLVNVLKSKSKRFKNYTNWDIAKYLWNCEYLEEDLDIDDYFDGLYDNEFSDKPSYVPSGLEMPNYRELEIK